MGESAKAGHRQVTSFRKAPVGKFDPANVVVVLAAGCSLVPLCRCWFRLRRFKARGLLGLSSFHR